MTVIVGAIAAWLALWVLELDPTSATIFVALTLAAWGLFAAVFWPFVPCPAPFCRKGKIRRPGKSRAYRRCAWCHGRGERVRWGRRFYDAIRPSKHGRR